MICHQRILNALESRGIVLNIEKGQCHSFRCLESGIILLEAKDGAYGPLDGDEV